MRSRGWHVMVTALSLLLPACSLQIPSDPNGTFARVEGGVLRAGASPQDGLVHAEDGTVSGSEAELVEDFAATLDASVEWTIGGEEFLVSQLENGELELVVGGLTEATPWVDRVGVTRGYPAIPGADGRALVMLVPPGENRLLYELEQFLDEATS